MAFDTHSLFGYSTVATAPSPANSGTSLVVASGDGSKFAIGQNVVVCPANTIPLSSNAEAVRITNISTDTLTITRQQEGTSARSILVGDQIFNAITPLVLTVIEAFLPPGTRVNGTTSTTTPTPNADTTDLYDLTALAAGATFGVPSGTPVNGQKLLIRIKDNGGAQTLAWSTSAGGYVAGGVALPTTTVGGKILTVGFIYNTANSLNKWMCVASAQEA